MAKKKAPAASLFDAEPSAERPADVPGLPADLPASWRAALEPETRQPYWADLTRFVAAERAAHAVMPPADDVFNAFKFIPLDDVKVLLLGQDPYPTPGVAHGLCFSVLPGVKVPASLKNFFTAPRRQMPHVPRTSRVMSVAASTSKPAFVRSSR